MNIVLIGPPGVGKGTQANFLLKKYDLTYITTGNILRQEVKSGSDFGREINKIISSGLLVSDDIVNKLVQKSIDIATNSILFDGYPRNLKQSKMLVEMLEKNEKKLDCIINMNLDNNTLIKRISGRFVCADCSAVYNDYFKNLKKEGICDHCGSENFIRRSDDNEEVIKKRLEVFYRESQPILDFFSDCFILHVSCNAHIDEVSQSISSFIDSKLILNRNH